MNITIIANGDFPHAAYPLSFLKEAGQVVCCDGAYEKYLRWLCSLPAPSSCHLTVVGDGDSLPSDNLDIFKGYGIHPQWIHIAEQETNDLTKAVTHIIRQTRQEGVPDREIAITLLGATGLREDHTLGNISLLGRYAEEYPEIEFRMVSDYGTFRPVRGRMRLVSFPGQQVSIFSLTPNRPVTVEGLCYPIAGRPLRQWWEGTLNEAQGDSFTVEGGLLIVYQTPILPD